ncbi:MAG: hypothetical protein KAJ13_05180 [Gemmatimonadetes bacterium]|nr:hypothetical protein [Gemmatimonadota bacterium]
MDRKKADWGISLLANLGVLGGLVFVGLEIRQNTSQLRADASYSITTIVNEMNAGIYADSTLADLLLRGEENLDALNAIERRRFDAFQFSRLNVAEYIQDLETEGVSGLNFRFVDHVVREFRTKPGLQAFIRDRADTYVGSKELLAQLLGR